MHSDMYKLSEESEGANTQSEQSSFEGNSTERNTELNSSGRINAEESTQDSCNVDMHDGDDSVLPQ